MKKEREKPYIWVSWLSKYIAGETMCEYSAWFKAHYTYEKTLSNFDLTKWIADHVSLLRRRTLQLQQDGWNVWIEDQNSFKCETDNYIVAGKPDIVASRSVIGGRTDPVLQHVVEDCKTGKHRSSDCIQVVLYSKFLEKMHSNRLRSASFGGNVIYSSMITPVKMQMYDEKSGFSEIISEAISKLTRDDPPNKYPSEKECKRCDIAECTERTPHSS